MRMFYRVMKGIHQFAANLFSYIPTKYYWNRSTSDFVIAKSKRVNFFLKHSVVFTGRVSCRCLLTVVMWIVKSSKITKTLILMEFLLLNFRYLLITDSWIRSGIEARSDCIRDWDCGCFSKMFARWITHCIISYCHLMVEYHGFIHPDLAVMQTCRLLWFSGNIANWCMRWNLNCTVSRCMFVVTVTAIYSCIIFLHWLGQLSLLPFTGQ